MGIPTINSAMIILILFFVFSVPSTISTINISGEEKLVVINDKQIKTLDIPKETKNHESTNN